MQKAIAKTIPTHIAIRFIKRGSVPLGKLSAAGAAISHMKSNGAIVERNGLFFASSAGSQTAAKYIRDTFADCNWQLTEKEIADVCGKCDCNERTAIEYCRRFRRLRSKGEL